MNVEMLNYWGAQALGFAWPMFWQSSLLILILFAADVLLRRKLRPAVRYALWSVLFLKLILPPTLAFPGSAAWWLRSPASTPLSTETHPAALANLEPGSEMEQSSAAQPYAPSAGLTPAGVLLIGSLSGTFILLGYVLIRGRRPAAIRLIEDRTRELARALSQARQQARFCRPVGLYVTERPMSPGACGLLRPIIVLPRLLAEQLPPLQLRAVLLHELFHLKRRDVLINCLQTLLQVIYWWHPLLWLANARIRRLREEAVDDAVMLALQDSAPAYPDALVRVARLALRASPALGMVGFGKPLRRRVERLLNTRPPRRAGLTALSVVGIALFSAATLPMAQPPAPLLKQVEPRQTVAINEQAGQEGIVPSAPNYPTSLADQPGGSGASESPPTPEPQTIKLPVPVDKSSQITVSAPASASVPVESAQPLKTVPAENVQPSRQGSPAEGPPSHAQPAQSEADSPAAPQTKPAVSSGDPMLPQVLPWVIQQDLERLRARVHSIIPPLVATDEAPNPTNSAFAPEPPGLRRALWETRRATTNFGVHMASRVNFVLSPLVKVHNKATEIGIVPKFLAIGPPPVTSTNAPSVRRFPVLSDLPILGRLFEIPAKPSENSSKSDAPGHSPKLESPKNGR